MCRPHSNSCGARHRPSHMQMRIGAPISLFTSCAFQEEFLCTLKGFMCCINAADRLVQFWWKESVPVQHESQEKVVNQMQVESHHAGFLACRDLTQVE